MREKYGEHVHRQPIDLIKEPKRPDMTERNWYDQLIDEYDKIKGKKPGTFMKIHE